MDHSPGELEGEIDHLSKDAAVEYLLMPERVKKLESQIFRLSNQVEDLRSDVQQLVQVLKEAVALMKIMGVLSRMSATLLEGT